MALVSRRRISRRSCFLTAALCIIAAIFSSSYTAIIALTPQISLEYAPQQAFNDSKLALLIEDRPSPVLAPLLIHFISVLPPDWRFRFIGSNDSVRAVNRSAAIRHQVDGGKLDLQLIPPNMSTNGTEMISRFLTSLWLYEVALAPAEWVLVFQTDSIVCANSPLSLDDFLEYDWVGAPWNPSGDWGGNGGLSLRRVSRIVDVLRNQQRANDSEPEDVWLAERLGHHPRAKVANGSVSLTFSGERHSGLPVPLLNDSVHSGGAPGPNHNTGYVGGIDDWRRGFYEPMGYHTGGSGVWLHGPIWGTPRLREHVYKYCPEVKMTLAMDMERYVPGSCLANWDF